jgi:hypothetical protein
VLITVGLTDERDVLAPIYRDSVLIRSLLLAQRAEVRARVDQALIEGARKYRAGKRIRIPMPALLAVARKQ